MFTIKTMRSTKAAKPFLIFSEAKFILLMLGFALLVPGLLAAQGHRFIYRYDYATDSLKPDSLQTELMILEVNEDGSEFFSKAQYESDSLQRIEMQQKGPGAGLTVASSNYRGNIRYRVEKTADYKVYLITAMDRTYKVYDDRPMKWTIQPEHEQIGEWQTQAATLDFAGRRWTAWFTTDIPIPDGPYKFHGLPGLIVKINSEDGTQKFVLEGILKVPAQKANNGNFKLFSDVEKPVEITEQQYVKQLKKYQVDPHAGIRQMLGNGVKRIIVNGKEVSAADFLHQLSQKKAKTDPQNNPIELKL